MGKFKLVSDARVRKLKPDHYVIYNDFGLYHYNGTDFALKEMHIIGPSRLLWNGLRFALEIQAIGIADDGQSLLTLVTLFEENEAIENGLLYELGFGNFDLLQLSQFSEDSASFFDVKNAFALSLLFDEQGRNLALFEGQSNVYCSDSIVLVNLDFKFVGSSQLNDFEFHLVPPRDPVVRLPPNRPAIIYTNILHSPSPLAESSGYRMDARVLLGVLRPLQVDPIVPADVVLQKMMLGPNTQGLLPLGYFDQTDDERMAVWDPRLDNMPKLAVQPVYRRSTHFKYIGR